MLRSSGGRPEDGAAVIVSQTEIAACGSWIDPCSSFAPPCTLAHRRFCTALRNVPGRLRRGGRNQYGRDQVAQRRHTERRMLAMFMTRTMIAAAVLAIATGCASVEPTTRTGMIHEVRFAERMTPANLRVEPGDEVRWVNQRSTPVTVEFLAGALNDVSCEQGFSKRGLTNLRGKLQESTTIKANGNASLCFTTVGMVTYNARMDSAVAGGQTIESGTIRVGQ